MLWRGEDFPDRPFLDLLSLPHHDDIIGHLSHHAHVVRDEDHRHAEFGLQFPDYGEDLGLNGNVQSGRRLVRDQEPGAAGERHGDHHALAHAA